MVSETLGYFLTLALIFFSQSFRPFDQIPFTKDVLKYHQELNEKQK